MRFSLFYNSPAWYKFVLAFLIIISFSILSFVVAILLGIPFFQLTAVDVNNFIFKGIQTQNIAFLKYLQVIQSIGTFFFPAMILAWLFTDNSYAYLKINTSVKFYSLLLVLFSLLFAIPIINFTAYLNSLITLPDSLDGIENLIRDMEQEASKLMESFLDGPTQ